jgi:hypothetical protein
MNIWKKSFFFVLLFISTGAFSQLEVKFDALGTIFGMSAVKAEYVINENIGAELSFNFRFGRPYLSYDFEYAEKQSGGGIKLESRYYFSPDYDADRYYMGVFYRNQSLSYNYTDEVNDSEHGTFETKKNVIDNKYSSLGVVLGYKYFFDSGITLDYGVGVGRYLSYRTEDLFHGYRNYIPSKFDFYFTFGVGYRFDWGEEKIDADFEEF